MKETKNEAIDAVVENAGSGSNNKQIIIIVVVVLVLLLCCACSTAFYAFYAFGVRASEEVANNVSDEYKRNADRSEELKKSLEENVSIYEELKKDNEELKQGAEMIDGLDALEQYLTEPYGFQIYPGTKEDSFVETSDEVGTFLTFSGIIPDGVESDVIAHYDRELSFTSWDIYDEDDLLDGSFYAKNDDILIIIGVEGSNPTLTTISVSFK